MIDMSYMVLSIFSSQINKPTCHIQILNTVSMRAKCNTIEYIYDYLCVESMYAVCSVSQEAASPVLFNSQDERISYMQELMYDNPDIILGYLEDECNSLNTICGTTKDFDAKCMFKMYTSFAYPIIRVASGFIQCVDNYNVKNEGEVLNYYFDCPESEECTGYACLDFIARECINQSDKK